MSIRENILSIYEDGYHTAREVCAEYYERHSEYPNRASVDRIIYEKTRKARACAIFVTLNYRKVIYAIVIAIVAITCIGIYYKDKEINNNLQNVSVSPIFR